MTTGKKPTKSAQGEGKRLTVKKQTLKDLGVVGKSIKGGAGTASGVTRNCTNG